MMADIGKIHEKFAEVDGPDWREKSVERLEMISSPVSTGMTYAGVYHGKHPWWRNRKPVSTDDILARWQEMFPDG